MVGTLDLVFTLVLCASLVLAGGVAVLLLPWTDAETDETARALRSLAARVGPRGDRFRVAVPVER